MHGMSERRLEQACEAPDTRVLAAVLPSIEPPVRDALNHWLRRRMAPVFRIGGSEYELTWRVVAEPRWHVIVELTAGVHRAWLALDGFAAIDPLMVGEPLTLMPAPLRQLAIQRLIARVVTNAPRGLAAAVDVRSVQWDAQLSDSGGCRLMFDITRRADGVQSMGALLFERPAALAWLDEILPVDDASRRLRARVRVPLHLQLGHSKVPMNDLGALRADDVVWIETASIARDGVAIEVVTAGQKFVCKGRARRHELKLVTAGPAATTVSKEAAQASVMTEGQAMSAERWRLDVPVTFDLGTLNMQVDEVEQLQPGQIVDLPQDVAAATVTLRVAGAPVAEGGLIVVGKRLGVRIDRTLGRAE